METLTFFKLIGTCIIILIALYGFVLAYVICPIKIERKAKESVDKFNEFFKTNYTYLEFAKIERRNPNWLELGHIRQYELIIEHGYETLMFRTCF